MKKTLSLCAILLLVGCSYLSAALAPNPNLASTLQSTAALGSHFEQQYLTLPDCLEKPKPPVCAEITVVNTMANLRDAAYKKITDYSDNPNSSTYEAAKAAVDAFKIFTESQRRN